jgi:hypothetical protein
MHTNNIRRLYIYLIVVCVDIIATHLSLNERKIIVKSSSRIRRVEYEIRY